MAAKYVLFITALLVAAACVAAAPAPSPFFDAVYDAVLGNGRRTYGYNNGYAGYNGYGGGYSSYPSYIGYGGYNEYEYRRPEPQERHHREGKSWKELCRVHFPDSIASPGKGGIVCPY